MIRFRLKELIADKSFEEGRRVTLDEVAKETDISRPTLTRIANKRGYTTSTQILDKLCVFFNCELSDLAEFIDSKE